MPASHLSRLVSQVRTATKADEQKVEQARSLTWRWDSDGMLVGSFRLAPDEGAEFIAKSTKPNKS